MSANPTRMSSARTPAPQCRYEVELYRLGRHVAETRRCRNRTKHPSGLCRAHRSDFHDESDGDA